MDPDITQILEAYASTQPAAPALHVPGRTSLTYADLGAQIRYVRERLESWGFRRGDVVVGLIPSRPEMVIAYATVPAAATFVPLSPALRPADYAALLTRLRPKALVIPRGLDHPVRAVAQRYGVSEIGLTAAAPSGMFELDLLRKDESLARAPASRPDWAYVLSTSGTTGKPKLVPMSHCRVRYAHGLEWRLQLAASDVGVHLQPMHHGHGMTALSVSLLGGGSVVCLQESDIDGFFAALDEYRVTWFTAGFTLHREILRRAPEFREAVARNRLRGMRNGSGWLEPDEVDRIEATFGAPLVMGYGVMETHVLTYDPLPPRMRKRGSVGVPWCNEVAIMSEAGAFCPTGMVGEIVARGPLVFDGYFDDPQATAAAFVDGWFRTGDLGRFDEDGYLFLHGRMKDMINRGGEKISPVELDAAIETIPGVRAAAAFAIPHPSLGEEIAAAVVRHDDAVVEAADIVNQLRLRMGPKRIPRKVFFVDRLPRTDTGKVRRSELPRLLGLDREDTATRNESAAAPALCPLEAALVGLWSSVLQASRIGVNDDFFLLGGDSLRGAQLLISVKAVFGVELSIELLFRNALTIAAMARAIESARSANTSVNPE